MPRYKLIPWKQIRDLPFGTKISVEQIDGYDTDLLSSVFQDMICGAIATITKRTLDFQTMRVELEDGRSTQMVGSCEENDPYDRKFIKCFNLYIVEDDGNSMTNSGRKHCFKCKCPTELKRDFSTFIVREMCPRCRI